MRHSFNYRLNRKKHMTALICVELGLQIGTGINYNEHYGWLNTVVYHCCYNGTILGCVPV